MQSADGTKRGPDFYVLGPPRTATTWLAHHLGRNPQLWMPPVKELHYFDVQKKQGINNKYRNLHLAQLAKRRGLPNEAYLEAVDKERQSWAFNYLTHPRDDAWYVSLFDIPGEKLRGEATPTYLRLPDEGIDSVLALNPMAKFIVMVRHPLFRFLSLIGKRIRDSKEPSEALGEVNMEMIAAANVATYGDHLPRWEARIQPDRLLKIWYEDVQLDAVDTLRRVAEFLAVEAPPAWLEAEVDQPRNASPEWDLTILSADLRERLLDAARGDLEYARTAGLERGNDWLALAERWVADPAGTREVVA